MACCLMTQSHYLNWCWLIIKGILWCGHPGAISQEVLINLISILEIPLVHLTWANELMYFCPNTLNSPYEIYYHMPKQIFIQLRKGRIVDKGMENFSRFHCVKLLYFFIYICYFFTEVRQFPNRVQCYIFDMWLFYSRSLANFFCAMLSMSFSFF